MNQIIDAHIHLDLYDDEEISKMMNDLKSFHCSDLLSVSFHLDSCKKNLALNQRYTNVHVAYGYHPEQPLPSEKELCNLLNWIKKHKDSMTAVGEVGLPYYLRQEQGLDLKLEGYIDLLDTFIQCGKEWDKPIVLHAVYDDAPTTCDLLEKHNVQKAHFHWFKGDQKTIERMIANGYYISITPDLLYEEEIQKIVQQYPLQQMMVETDGPWRFEGKYAHQMTHPKMIHDTIQQIAQQKKAPLQHIYETLYQNTKTFYFGDSPSML